MKVTIVNSKITETYYDNVSGRRIVGKLERYADSLNFRVLVIIDSTGKKNLIRK